MKKVYSLQDSMALFSEQGHSVLDSCLDSFETGYWTLRAADCAISCSQGFCDLLELEFRESLFSLEEIEKKFYPEDRHVIRGILVNFYENTNRKDINFVFRVYSADSIKRLQTTVRPLFDELGSFVGLFGLSRNIESLHQPEKNQPEKTVANLNAQLETVIQLTDLGAFYWNLQENVWTVDADTMKNFFGISANHRLTLDALFRHLVPEDRAVAEETFEKCRNGKLNSYDLSFRATDAHFQMHRVRLIGHVAEWDKNGKPTLVVGITKINAESAPTAKSNFLQNEHILDLFDSIVSAIIILDQDLNVTYINNYGTNLFGYSREEMSDANRFRLLFPMQDERGEPLRDILLARMFNPKIPHFNSVNWNTTKSGQRIWLSWSIHSFFDENDALKEVFCVGHNITEIKEAEFAYLQSEFRYRNLLETAESAIVLLDNDLKIEYANGFIERWLGYEKGELIGLHALDILVSASDEDGFRQRESIQSLYHDKNSATFRSVVRNVRKDGSFVWGAWSRLINRDENGNIIDVVCIGNDITDQKIAEEIIRERELALISALAVSRAGTWLFDPYVEEIQISDEIAGILRSPPIGRLKIRDFIRQWVHPEDHFTFWEGFLTLFSDAGNFETECRMIDHKGNAIHVVFNGLVIKDHEGRVRKIIGILMDISSRVEREKEIEESRQRYRTLFEHSNDAVVLLDDGKFVEGNRQMTVLFGVNDFDQLRGRSLWEFAPEYQPDGMLSKQKAGVLMSQAVDSLSPLRHEWRARRVSGLEFDALISFSQVPVAGQWHLLVVIRDLTDQKKAARVFESYRAYLSVLAEMRKKFYGRSEQEIIQEFLVDLANNFGFVKVWYAQLLDEILTPIYHAGSLRHCIDLTELSTQIPTQISTSPDRPDRKTAEFPLLTAIHNNTFATLNSLDRSEEFAPWKDFVVESKVRSLFAMSVEIDGRAEGGIVLYSHENNVFDSAMTDYIQNVIRELGRIVSEKRFWEEQKRALRVAKENAVIAAEAKSRFLANMSHEIRTPMTAILGYTEIVADTAATPEGRREAALVIRNNTEYLLQILNDILDFSKIEADKVKIEVCEVFVAPVLEEISMLYSNKAKEKSLSFTISNATAFPERIHTDPTRLKQVLLNLVSNAVKFTVHGGISLSVSWVAETPFSLDGKLRLDVSDTGIGIAPETIPSLFSAFHQEDSSTTRRFGGTGLGLAISKRLIEILGGRISVQSEIGEGTTFSIELIQQLPDDIIWIKHIGEGEIEPVKTPKPKEPAQKVLQGYRILLAEDGKDNQRLFNLILTKAGANVTMVENGLIAMECALKNWEEKQPFDLIVMDMQMPVMDGYTAVRELRKAGYVFPIIALTAHSMQEEMKRCLSVGCNDYATKPILREALIEVALKNIKAGAEC